jgi:hypothetical protein
MQLYVVLIPQPHAGYCAAEFVFQSKAAAHEFISRHNLVRALIEPHPVWGASVFLTEVFLAHRYVPFWCSYDFIGAFITNDDARHAVGEHGLVHRAAVTAARAAAVSPSVSPAPEVAPMPVREAGFLKEFWPR